MRAIGWHDPRRRYNGQIPSAALRPALRTVVEKQMTSTYEHSGKAPLTGLTLAVLFGLGTATVLGVIYSFAVVYIARVYFNGLLAIVFGVAVGAAVGYVAKLGHVRSRLLPSAIAVLCSLVG